MRAFLKYILLCVLGISSLQTFSSTYYWVGGSGSWSDISHWSSVSGGPANYIVVPGTADEVIFDANSFPAYNGAENILLPPNAFTGRFEFSFGQPVKFSAFAAGNFVLSVYGNLSLNSNFQPDPQGVVKCISQGTIPNTIRIPGTHLGRLEIDAPSSLVIRDTCQIDFLLVQQGKVTITSDSISIGYLVMNGPLSKKVEILSGKCWVSMIQLSTPQDSVLARKSRIFGLTALSNSSFSSPASLDLGEVHLGNGNVGFFSYSGGGGFHARRIYTGKCNLLLAQDTYIDTLTIDNPVTITIGPGNVNIGRMEGTGTCLEPIHLRSSEYLQTEIRGTVSTDLRFCAVYKIRFVNPVSIQQSADLGGNTGIGFISPRTPQKLYWIGGKGNYEDPAHWSLSPGGTSGSCIPWPTDTAVFDAASFPVKDTVFYNREIHVGGIIADCDNLETFTSRIGYQSITLYGSFLNHKKASTMKGLALFFRISKDAFLKTSGSRLAGFTLSAGNNELILLDDTLQVNQITVENGILNIRNRTVKVGSFTLNSYGSTVLYMENTRLQTSSLLINLSTYPGIIYATGADIEVNGLASVYCPGSYLPVLRMKRLGPSGTASEIFFSEIGRLDLDLDGLYNISQTNIDTLKVFTGTSIALNTNLFTVRKRFEAKGDCQRPVFITNEINTNQDVEIALQSTCSVDLEFVNFKKLVLSNKPGIVAYNSTDMGGSSGFTISTGSGSTLYWIGGKGNWGDPAHWSLSSGGPSSGCVPSLNDIAVFDAGSFLTTGDTVFIRSESGCRLLDMRTVNVPFVMHRSLSYTLYVRESAYFSSFLKSRNFKVNFEGDLTSGEIYFNGMNVAASEFEFGGGGTWSIMDNPRKIGNMRVNHARLHLQSDSLQVNGLIISYGVSFPYAEVFFHRCVVTADYVEKHLPGALFADSSTIYFSNNFFTQPVTGQKDRFFKVIRTFTPGMTGNFLSDGIFQWLELNGNVQVAGNLVTDTFLIYNADRIDFTSGYDYEVKNYFYAIGNNCHKMQLAGLYGTAARLVSAGAQFDCDHLIIDNFPAAGTAAFNGGTFTQLSGVTGAWAPGVSQNLAYRIGTVYSCSDSVLIDIEKMYGSALSYQWNTGAATAKTWFKDTGYYYLRISYPGNCNLQDTLHLVEMNALQDFLPSDTTLCGTDNFRISPVLLIPPAWKKRWSDGSGNNNLSVRTSGQYYLELKNSACTVRDSIRVRFSLVNKELLYTKDSTFCNGGGLQISANVLPSDTISWTDGSTAAQRWITHPGMYRLQLYQDGCVFSDSVAIHRTDLAMALSGDTIFCKNDSVQLTLTPNIGLVRWESGIPGASYWAADSGWYKVSREDSGCIATDSIYLSLWEYPDFELPEDSSVCSGNQVFVDVKGKGYSWSWSDNIRDSSRWVQAPGTYYLTSSNGHCQHTDSFVLKEIPLPPVFAADQVLCEGSVLNIPIPSRVGESYLLNGMPVADSFRINSKGDYALKIFNLHCERTDSFEVQEKENPRNTLPDTLDFCELVNGSFFPLSDPGTSLFWEGNDVTGQSIPVSPGIYTYRLVNASNCVTEAQLPVKGCGCRLYFPNAFTPNNDGNNPVFGGQGCSVKNYRLLLYNRWGELLFESSDPAESWDGTFKGGTCADGVYVWTVQYDTYEDFSGTGRISEKGTVTLLR